MKPWSVEECEAYAQQLRDKTRANTAEDAAQAIEYLLGLVSRQWVGLTDEEIDASKPPLSNDAVVWELAVEWAEAKLKEKNT